MLAALAHGFARLRRDRTRALLTAGGIAAASAMVAAAATLVLALGGGFDRTAARADLPDVTARFDPEPFAAIASRVGALANIRKLAYRYEADDVSIEALGNVVYGTAAGVLPGARGYAVLSGRDVAGGGEVVVEPGFARAWHLRIGDRLNVSGSNGTLLERIVGIGLAPDSVAYPLIRTPRVYVAVADARHLAGAGNAVDAALLWVNDRSQLDVTLEQARAATFGVPGVRFVTRAGFQQLIGRAAGIVIALLAAFSIAALAAAGIMLSAAAASEVQRRREAIGLLCALGASPAQIAAGYALEAFCVAAPAAALGIVGGWLAVDGSAGRLLALLDELMPGAPAVAVLLLACWAGIVLLVGAATWLPAYRAARRPVVESLREADVVPTPRSFPLPALAGLGARLALARPLRAGVLVSVLAASAAVILLILTIASVLGGLQENAQTLGTSYQLVAPAAGGRLAAIRAIHGVAAAAPRYEVDAADSFQLGESFRFIAFPGDVTRFEAPPLGAGRRVTGSGDADVGLGLAQALDLHVGSVLAAQLPSGAEARFRVVGVVQALRDQGLVAYVQPHRLLQAMPSLTPDIAIRLRPGTPLRKVRDVLSSRGLSTQRTGGISEDVGAAGSVGRTSFLRVLSALLRSVAALDGAVCIYALAQMLALIARERRRAVALLRAIGASRTQVLSVFAGAALMVAVLATPIAILVERLVLGPGVASLAVSYVTLPLRAGVPQVLPVLLGVAVAVALTAAWATRTATAGAAVATLRDE